MIEKIQDRVSKLREEKEWRKEQLKNEVGGSPTACQLAATVRQIEDELNFLESLFEKYYEEELKAHKEAGLDPIPNK